MYAIRSYYAYTPLSINQQARTNTQLSATAVRGLNLEGLPEMMKLEFAKKIVNYIPYAYGAGLRKGIEEEAEKAGLTTVITSYSIHYTKLYEFLKHVA